MRNADGTIALGPDLYARLRAANESLPLATRLRRAEDFAHELWALTLARASDNYLTNAFGLGQRPNAAANINASILAGTAASEPTPRARTSRLGQHSACEPS